MIIPVCRILLIGRNLDNECPFRHQHTVGLLEELLHLRVVRARLHYVV